MILLSFLFVRVLMSFAAKIQTIFSSLQQYNILNQYVKQFLTFHPGFCTLPAFSGFIIPLCYNRFKQIILFFDNCSIVVRFISSAVHSIFLIFTSFSAKHPLSNL